MVERHGLERKTDLERHVHACLNFSLSFCLRVRAVAWRHSDYDVSRPAAVYALPVTSLAAMLAACQ